MKFIIEKGKVIDVKTKEYKNKKGEIVQDGQLVIREMSVNADDYYASSTQSIIKVSPQNIRDYEGYKDKEVTCKGNVKTFYIAEKKSSFSIYELESIKLV